MTIKSKIVNSVLLMCILISITSCNGQNTKNDLKSEIIEEPSKIRQDRISLANGISPQTMFRSSFKDNDGNMWFGTTGAGIYKWDGKYFTCYSDREGLTNIVIYGITQDQKGQIWIATDNGIFFKNGEKFRQIQLPISTNSGNSFLQNKEPLKEKYSAYCIICDRNGNIWFGTENRGLWCYNGKEFKNYSFKNNVWFEIDTNKTSLNTGGLIQSLLEDSKGNIWISGIGAPLNYFDGQIFHSLSDEFNKTTTKGINNSNMTSGHIFQMHQDKKGTIWMATRDNGICRYNGKTVERFSAKDGVEDDGATCIYEDKKGNIWFGSLGIAGTAGGGKRGITLYDGLKFTSIPTTKMRNNQIWTLQGDNSGNIWIGTKEFGLYRYDGKQFIEMTKL